MYRSRYSPSTYSKAPCRANPAQATSFVIQIRDNNQFHESRLNHCLRPHGTPIYQSALTKQLYGTKVQPIPVQNVSTCIDSICNPVQTRYKPTSDYNNNYSSYYSNNYSKNYSNNNSANYLIGR